MPTATAIFSAPAPRPSLGEEVAHPESVRKVARPMIQTPRLAEKKFAETLASPQDDCPPLDVYSQMALDEAVLLSLAPQKIFLRFYDWTGPAATFGCHQSLNFARQQLEIAGLKELPLARRLTGGGLVFHGEDLTFSLIFPWERVSSPSLIYEKIHGAILKGLMRAGANPIIHGAPAQSRDLKKICFSSPEPFDLTDSSGKKILGGALRHKNERGLYQGSLQIKLIHLDIPKAKATVVSGLNSLLPQTPQEFFNPFWIHESEKLRAKYESEDWNARIP